MTNKITIAGLVITAASTAYLGFRVQVLEPQLAIQVDKSAALAVQKFERDFFARQDAIARARAYAMQQAERNQRAAISRDLYSIPNSLFTR